MEEIKFIGEIDTGDGKLYRVVPVYALDLEDTLKLLVQELEEDEMLYQVCVHVQGSKLPQPMWDFFNGQLFELEV